MSPIILVTQDSQGRAVKVEWFEDQAAYVAGAVTLLMQFRTAQPGWRYVCVRTSSDTLTFAATEVIEIFDQNPWADISRFATHIRSEPVPEVAA